MADDPKPDPKPDPDPDAGAKKALEEERKARREAEKSANDLRAKLKDIEDAGKDANQKLLDRIEAAEKKAADADDRVGKAEANALRLEVAAAKGLNPAQAKRLAGTTRDELEADADELLETFPSGDPKESKETVRTRPREQLRGGLEPNEDPVETNPAKLAETVPRH